MNEENRLVIKQLNKFGRVPQTQELLKIIEDLEHNWNELKKWLEDEIKEYEESLFNLKEPPTRILVIMNILSKMQELEEGGNNDC